MVRPCEEVEHTESPAYVLKGLGCKLNLLLDKSRFVDPYTSTQLSTKAFHVVTTDIFVAEMVLTFKESRLVITNRNRLPRLVVSN